MSRAVNKFITATSGSGAGDVIEQSLMFNTADTAYLNRTPSSAGNRRTFTLSTWLKTTDGFAGDPIFCCSTGTNDASTTYIAFYQGKMYYYGYNTIYRTTNRVFRDVGAWYHFVWAIDSTQGTADNRIRLYVNGVEETSFATKNNPAQNYDFIINSTNEHQLGDEGNQTGGFPPFDGSMAEVHFIDGAQLTPSSFGETDSDTGEWIPKETTGLTYGTNGFYLKFVSGAIGTDSSGQGNNYTANNLTNADVLLDTPNNNFPTINSLEPYNTTISNLSQGNLHVKAVTYDSGYYGNHIATFKVPESGKWYIETRMAVESGTGNTSWIGVMPQTLAIIPKDGTGATDGNYAANSSFTGMVADLISGVDTIRLFDGGSAQATISSATATSYIIALALDVDNNKVYGGYDSGSGITWLASGDPAAGSNGQAHTFTRDTIIQLEVGPNSGSNSNSKQTLNFGQNGTFCGLETAGGNSDSAGEGNFFYSPPSGFKALCSKNLPNPAIKKSAEHFNTILYTGNNTDDRTLTGVGFQPDLVWIKTRDTTNYHQVFDSVRGVSKRLNTNTNSTEYSDSDPNNSLVAFTSDGFTVDDSSGYSDLNASAHTYVAWNWKANGSGSSNTDGTINSTVSANTSAGFSIVTFTGTSGTGTIGHGLSKAPETIWHKNRDATASWTIYHVGMASDPETDYMQFNSTNAATDNSTVWNDTAPTSTVFSVGQGSMTNGDDSVAYCFHSVEGFSKFDYYIGNGNANGPYINTGFTPKLVIIQNVETGSSNWRLLDTEREPANVVNNGLWANLANDEGSSSTNMIDILSNGFKIRGTGNGVNANNDRIIYMTWAEFPFSYSNAR